MENSISANAVDEDTKDLDEMVSQVKKEHDAGGRYMTTLGELMDKIVEEAVEDVRIELQAELTAKDAEITAKDAEIEALKKQIAEMSGDM